MTSAGWVVAVVIATSTALTGWVGRWRVAPTRPTVHGDEPPTRARDRPPPAPDALQWAALLDALAAEARSGSSLSTAWTHSITRHPLHGAAVRPGCSLQEVVHRRSPRATEAVVLHTVRTAVVLGGAAAPTLDAGASLLRERAAAAAEALAHSAQARLSARVLTAVPVAFAAWSAAGSATFRAAVVTPAGTAAMVAGGALNLTGWWWMRRVIAGVTR